MNDTFKNYKPIPILMYHSIAEPPSNEVMRSIHVRPRNFQAQMKLLKLMGYRGLSMENLEPYLTGAMTGKVVGITFDDGYVNNLEHAAPVLRKLGFSATCYIVSSALGSDNFWDREVGIPSNPIMKPDDLHQWINFGLEVGCHTHTHPHLPELTDPQQSAELSENKKTLEEIVNRSIRSFCYPYGHYNETTLAYVKALGFKTATTMIRGRTLSTDGALELPRVPVTFHTLPHLFALKILTNYEDKRRGR